MPSLKDIRRRIGSVKNTQKITKAMKMVAAAKLNKAQDRVEAARPYSKKMRQVILNLTERVEVEAHPLLAQREFIENNLVYVVSSNRGLCGGFNAALFREIEVFAFDEELAGETVDIVTIGDKAEGYYERSEEFEIADRFDDVIGDVGYKKAKKLADHAVEHFLSGEYDAIWVAFNEFVSAIQYNTLVRPILPLSIETLHAHIDEDSDEAHDETDASDYIYEPDEQQLLDETLPSYVEVMFLQALLESDAAEQGARMTAMDNATQNAEEMIDDLTLQYNRARQAYITKEICEIVSGAESLKG